jgi:hypothetical protein
MVSGWLTPPRIVSSMVTRSVNIQAAALGPDGRGRITSLVQAAVAARKMRQVPGVPRLASRCQLPFVEIAERPAVIAQRVQHYPPGDQLDRPAPEQLGPCLAVHLLLSDGQAATHDLAARHNLQP